MDLASDPTSAAFGLALLVVLCWPASSSLVRLTTTRQTAKIGGKVGIETNAPGSPLCICASRAGRIIGRGVDRRTEGGPLWPPDGLGRWAEIPGESRMPESSSSQDNFRQGPVGEPSSTRVPNAAPRPPVHFTH